MARTLLRGLVMICYLKKFFILLLTIVLLDLGFNFNAQAKSGWFDQEPSFAAIIETVFTREHLNFDEMELWKQKMKKAPWLPTLSVGFTQALRETKQVTLSDNVSVSGNGVVVGPQDNNFNQVVNQGSQVQARVLWNLSNLVYPQETVSFLHGERDLSHDRAVMEEQIYKIFEERRKLWAQYFSGKVKGDDKIVIKVRVEALTQRLDAVTQRQFHQKWNHLL